MEPEESNPSSDALKEIQQAIDAITTTQPRQEEDNLPNPIGTARQVRNMPDTDPSPEDIHRQQERNYWRKSVEVQWCLFFATFAAFGAAAWYAYTAGAQKDTMDRTLRVVISQAHAETVAAEAAKKSADAAKSQMESVEAKEEFSIRLDANAGQAFVSLDITNYGHRTARNVRGTITVGIESLPSRKRLQPDVTKPLLPQIQDAPDSPDRSTGITKRFDIPGLTVDIFQSIQRLQVAVRMEGRFTYDNGFGTPIAHEVCRIIAAGDFQSYDPIRKTGGPDMSPGMSDTECNEFGNRLAILIKEKRIVQDEAKQKAEKENPAKQ